MATRFLVFLLVCLSSFGQITNVNIGSSANDGSGDSLRVAFSKLNTNTTWLASQLASATNSIRQSVGSWYWETNNAPLVFIGDSITYGGYGGSTPYPEIVSAQTGAPFQNEGMAGATSTQVLATFLTRPYLWTNFVIIGTGRNDQDISTPTWTNTALNAISNIVLTITGTGNNKYRVVETINRNSYDEYTNTAGWLQRVQFNSMLSDVYGSKFIPIRRMLVTNNLGTTADLINQTNDVPAASNLAYNDLLHPSTRGNQLYAAAITASISNELSAWRGTNAWSADASTIIIGRGKIATGSSVPGPGRFDRFSVTEDATFFNDVRMFDTLTATNISIPTGYLKMANATLDIAGTGDMQVDKNWIPTTTGLYSLGLTSRKWTELWLTTAIYLGGTTIEFAGTGDLQLNNSIVPTTTGLYSLGLSSRKWTKLFLTPGTIEASGTGEAQIDNSWIPTTTTTYSLGLSNRRWTTIWGQTLDATTSINLGSTTIEFSGLGDVQLNNNIVPTTTTTYDLGGPTRLWRTNYTQNIETTFAKIGSTGSKIQLLKIGTGTLTSGGVTIADTDVNNSTRIIPIWTPASSPPFYTLVHTATSVGASFTIEAWHGGAKQTGVNSSFAYIMVKE